MNDDPPQRLSHLDEHGRARMVDVGAGDGEPVLTHGAIAAMLRRQCRRQEGLLKHGGQRFDIGEIDLYRVPVPRRVAEPELDVFAIVVNMNRIKQLDLRF